MLETLEELEEGFKKVWQKKVPMQELTVMSIYPSSRRAIVLTNKGFYLLQKKIFGISFKRWDRMELKSASVKEAGILLEFKNSKLQIDFSIPKLRLRRIAAEKINENIKSR